MVILLAGVALGAPVSCDGDAAHAALDEARISEDRVAVTHPWLVPGLARAAQHSDAPLRDALRALCQSGELSIDRGESWDAGTWSAHTLRVIRSERAGCSLVQHTVALTVGLTAGAPPTYRLRGHLPVTHTPIGDCPEPARFREVSVLEGAGTAVRLTLVIDRVGDQVTGSEVQVRRATAGGWVEQTLARPAPDRLLGGASGPRFALHQADGEVWVVSHHHREMDEGGCRALPGQTVWTWDGGSWEPRRDGDARRLLASHAAWRIAGEDGWLAILAQDTEDDLAVLEARRQRLQTRRPDGELLVLKSADFPGLNAGYLVVSPVPSPTRAAAEAERALWPQRATSYVKQAWAAPDPCEIP